MKTWQMIKALTENPTKRFTYDTATEGSYVTVKDVTVVWRGNQQEGQMLGVNIDNEGWEEVKQPVSFMEAFKALRSDCKNIYCMNGKSRFDFMGERIGAHVFDEDLIGQGKWYIED